MFAIQPINKFYTTRKFIGISKDNLPYPVYEGNDNCPSEIHDFTSLENAVDYLTKFLNRENINVLNLSISQTLDIALVNDANDFNIIEYEVDEGHIKVLNTYPQTQFARNNWYKG